MGLLTKAEVKAKLGISDTTMWRWIRDDFIPPATIRVSNKKQWWDEETLDKWLLENTEVAR